MAHVLEGAIDGSGLRFAVVVARFNQIVTGYLLDGAREALRLGAAKLPIKTRFIQRIAE